MIEAGTSVLAVDVPTRSPTPRRVDCPQFSGSWFSVVSFSLLYTYILRYVYCFVVVVVIFVFDFLNGDLNTSERCREHPTSGSHELRAPEENGKWPPELGHGWIPSEKNQIC